MKRIAEAWQTASEKCKLLALRARNEQSPHSVLFHALDRISQSIEREGKKPRGAHFRDPDEAFCRARDVAVMLVIRVRDEFPESSAEFDVLDDLVFAMIERVDSGPLGKGWRPAADSADGAPV